LKNTPLRSISASGSNFNPQNTQCIPAVEIFPFLELKRNWAFFKGLVEDLPAWNEPLQQALNPNALLRAVYFPAAISALTSVTPSESIL
jgi:hypothetical protein